MDRQTDKLKDWHNESPPGYCTHSHKAATPLLIAWWVRVWKKKKKLRSNLLSDRRFQISKSEIT